ncbi:MAG: hypothetical protein KDK36_20370 [Leptospiraceae bacterium]|nr:hypothetical protein [Leptospiraceae bacterium]
MEEVNKIQKEKRKKTSRHAITHSVVTNRYKKFKISTILLFSSWILFFLAILNSAFIFIFKESVFSGFFELIMGNIWLRLLLIGLFIFMGLDFARALGKSNIIQPFNRFIRHLSSVTVRGGDKFAIREKDEYFLPVAIAFNQMINRIKNTHEKEIKDTKFLIEVIEKNKMKMDKESLEIYLTIKHKVETVDVSEIEEIKGVQEE